ncbi:MAG: hypothetical protein Q4B60_01280 [Erysipelotrichaceae bacterium]|nr:hypothetical protein [Erysipelotrichaceae bacterium]
MDKKIKYPIEAFALAMVLFAADMKTAMLLGITLIFGDVLNCFLSDLLGDKYNKAIISQIACLVMFGSSLLMLGVDKLAVKEVLALGVIWFAMFKHAMDNAEIDEHVYGDILFKDSIAYLVMVVLAIIREYLAKGKIFGFALNSFAINSTAYGKPAFALIFAGLAIALLNKLFKMESDENTALWVCLPVICVEIPFVLDNVSTMVGTFIGATVVSILFVSLRKRLVFSETLSHIKGLASEMALLGFIYMIVAFL